MEENKNYCVYRHKSFDDRVYIGITCQSVNRRWRNGQGYNNNYYFAHFIRKYGWDSMEHKVLYSNLSQKEAEEKEIKLIKFYKSTIPSRGFNMTKGGNSYGCHSDESKHKMSINRRSCADKNLKSVRCIETGVEYKGVREAERQTGVPSPNISANCKGKVKHAGRDVNGNPLHWEYTNKALTQSREVYQYNLHGILEAKYNTAKDASNSTGISERSISECCRKNGISGGYFWRSQETIFDENIFEQTMAKMGCKSLIQYDFNMNKVAQYYSAGEASRVTGFARSDISACCNGKCKTLHGYIWKYAE